MPRIQAFLGDDSNTKRTKASTFVNFLLKIYFIPVNVTEEKIIFKIFHWKTIVYILYVLGFYSFYYFYPYLLGIDKQSSLPSTDIQLISEYILFALLVLCRTFSLVLSHGLQKLNPRRFNNTSHRNPKQMFRIILSFFMYVSGLFLIFVDLEKIRNIPFGKLALFVVMHLIITFIDFFWEVSAPLLIQILAEDFIYDCKNASAEENFIDIIEWYQELNGSLQLYCLFLYSSYQFVFIFDIYNNFSVVTTTSQLTAITIFSILGKLLLSVSMAWNIIALTSSLDSAFDSLQEMKEKIQKMIVSSYGQTEKQLNYLLERIKSLKPFSACGYFEISKSTLTSMLSVRYFPNKKNCLSQKRLLSEMSA